MSSPSQTQSYSYNSGSNVVSSTQNTTSSSENRNTTNGAGTAGMTSSEGISSSYQSGSSTYGNPTLDSNGTPSQFSRTGASEFSYGSNDTTVYQTVRHLPEPGSSSNATSTDGGRTFPTTSTSADPISSVPENSTDTGSTVSRNNVPLRPVGPAPGGPDLSFLSDTQRTPGPSRHIEPYCDNIAFLKCPNCQKCIPLKIENANTSGSQSDESYYSSLPSNLTGKLQRIRGGMVSPQENIAMDIQPIGQEQLVNRAAGGLHPHGDSRRLGGNNEQSNRGPTLPCVAPTYQTGPSSVFPTSGDSRDPACDPFSQSRQRNSPGGTTGSGPQIELRRNPVSGPDCLPFASTPRSVRNVTSTGFNTNPAVENNAIVAVNNEDTWRQRWRQCDENFVRDMGTLLPRLERITNEVRSLVNNEM